MRVIVILLVLLVFVDLTVQIAKIARNCPNREILEERYGSSCMKIKCRLKKILKFKHDINKKNLYTNLSPKFYNTTRCKMDLECEMDGQVGRINKDVAHLMYPKCCKGYTCLDTGYILQSLTSGSTPAPRDDNLNENVIIET